MSESRRETIRDQAGVSELARLDSLRDLGEKGEEERSRLLKAALAVLGDRKLKRNEGLRFAAANLIVAMLPETFEQLENVMRDFSSPLWYEVHFSTMVCLDRDDLSKSDQTAGGRDAQTLPDDSAFRVGVRRLEGRGSHLGDEWFSSETVRLLERALLQAPYVAGRLGALHGIEHAINHADPAGRKRLFRLLRRVSRVRSSAKFALKGIGCVRVPPP